MQSAGTQGDAAHNFAWLDVVNSDDGKAKYRIFYGFKESAIMESKTKKVNALVITHPSPTAVTTPESSPPKNDMGIAPVAARASRKDRPQY